MVLAVRNRRDIIDGASGGHHWPERHLCRLLAFDLTPTVRILFLSPDLVLKFGVDFCNQLDRAVLRGGSLLSFQGLSFLLK